MTFWEHLDELRSRLWRILVAALAAAVVCFCFKEPLFRLLLLPKPAGMQLISVELPQQFLIHLRVSFMMGLLVVAPYVLYQLFAFIAPGLYRAERRLTVRAVVGGYILFLAGVALNFFVIFPFTVNFLGNYQVVADVTNHITLQSYISLLLTMSLLLGAMFELPVVCWLLGRIGLLKAAAMRRYRRHALVVILVLGAVVTPTGDPVTLSLVALPVYALYELSILLVARSSA